MTDLEAAIRETVLEINQKVRSQAARGVNYLRNAAIEVLSQNGGGRRYGSYVASAPGQPPAPDTGNLRRNWRQLPTVVTPTGRGLGIRIKLAIKSDMPYQPFLEKGTRKMKPRPHINRIKAKARPKIAALF